MEEFHNASKSRAAASMADVDKARKDDKASGMTKR